MARPPQFRDIARWVVYSILVLCLAFAVLLQGGVDPAQWQWIAAAISLACWLCLVLRSRRVSGPGNALELQMLGVLLLWMLLQMTPLPPAVVAFLSPNVWALAKAARITAGYDLNAWLPLSVAPGATLQRLLNVLPAMAAFVAVREMARWRNGRRLWILVAPVIAIAFWESLLGKL